MQISNSEELVLESKKVKKKNSVALSERDIKILEFILEMKFANLENIFERFFKITLSGEPAKSKEWAIRRLQQLSKAGYLNPKYSFSKRKKYYLATPEAYRAVSRALPEKDALRPSTVIDHRTFEHDCHILQARIQLENQNAAASWISDKRLRTNAALSGGLTAHNVPDAIYVDNKGKRIAFEFELTHKSKDDYRNKIHRYVSILRSTNLSSRPFDKVIYVCAKNAAYQFLMAETRVYGELFEIKRFSQFLLEIRESA